jgi:uncharacterized RDD family membrane protein YckC
VKIFGVGPCARLRRLFASIGGVVVVLWVHFIDSNGMRLGDLILRTWGEAVLRRTDAALNFEVR